MLIAEDESEKAEAVAAFIRKALQDGVEAAEIGLFVRSRDEPRRARAAAAHSAIFLTTQNLIAMIGGYVAHAQRNYQIGIPG